MTGEEPEETLDPATEARLRALLREARVTDPMPPEIAARLDNVIAGLAADAERAAGPGLAAGPERAGGKPEPADRDREPAPVIELASRRRRNLAGLLVAAAAVVAIGVGLPPMLDRGGPDSGVGSASDSASDNGAGGATSQEEAASSLPAPGQTTKDGSDTSEPLRSAETSRLRIGRPGELRADLRLLLATPDAAMLQGPSTGALDCRTAPLPLPPDAAAIPVRLDRAGRDLPGLAVVSPATGEVREVTVYRCDRSEPLRRLTLRGLPTG